MYPRLLDRDANAGDQLCGGFLGWRTVDALRAIGLDPVDLGARRIDRLALFAGDREATWPLPATAYGLSRRVLDGALRRRALELGATLEIDQARMIEGTTVIGRRRDWQAPSLFLATGKHDVRGTSRPRIDDDPALGLRVRFAANSDCSALLANRIELHLFRGGYAGIDLQEDGSANVCLAVRKSLLAASGNPQQLLDDLAAQHPAFARRLADERSGVAIETVGAVPYGWIAPTTRTGVFRLGDQAAVIPSLAGEGIAIALASGALAARCWLEHGPDGALPYQRALARRARPPVRVARVARSLAEAPLVAQLGLRLAHRVPPLVRWLMEASRIEPDAPLAQLRPAP